MVSDLDVCDALADALDDTTTLVAENDREGTFGILACCRCQLLSRSKANVTKQNVKADRKVCMNPAKSDHRQTPKGVDSGRASEAYSVA